MSQTRKIMISLPDSLLDEIDSHVERKVWNRSAFIRTAAQYYIEELRKEELRELLKRGYREMAQLNLALAEEYAMDNHALSEYEQKLAEAE